MYSTPRKSVAWLYKLFSMKTAFSSAPVQKPVSSLQTAEKLDLELDFVESSPKSKTLSTHPHILFSPMHYEPGYAYPLLVWLHGTGGDERQLLRIMPAVSMRNYVAVAPRGILVEQPANSPTLDLSISAILQRPKVRYDWPLSSNIIEQRIFDCIAVAQERCNIAAHRIFIAGFGTGGTAALRLAMLYPERFAGVGAFGSEIPSDNQILPCWQTPQPLSVLLGMDASAAESVGKTMELFYTAGLSANVCEYPGTKTLTPEMLQDMNRWMMEIVCQPAAGLSIPNMTDHSFTG